MIGNIIKPRIHHFTILATLYFMAGMQWLSMEVLSQTNSQNKTLQRVSPDQIHKAEWLNKEIEIEDRISEFLKHGTKYSEIRLKGTPVPVTLPPQLRLDRPSPLPRGRFTGRVIKIGNFFQFMVTTMEFLPSEREELAQKVSELSPTNAQKRLELASWAESLATRYKDASLKQSVSQLRSEAYRILGTQEDQPGTPPGSSAIETARDAKKAGSDPVIIHGLAHLGLRKAFAKLEDQAGLETLSKEVAELLPDSVRRQLGEIKPETLDQYRKDPLKIYLEASSADRRLLDRLLMVEALEKGLMVAVVNHPDKIESLMKTAQNLIPEKPELANSIRDRGLLKLVETSDKLHRDDLIKLVNQVRDKFGQAELARKLSRKWLDSRQATQLAEGDTEGRFSLAQDYLALLGDKRSAAALLRECLTLDPEMKKAAESLAGLGWKKDGDRWIDPDESSSPPSVASSSVATPPKPGEEMPRLPGGRVAEPPPASSGDPQSLVGLTQAQITSKFGMPEHKSRMLTQGQLHEQWYFDTPGGRQVVQFVKKSVRSVPTVKAVYQFAK